MLWHLLIGPDGRAGLSREGEPCDGRVLGPHPRQIAHGHGVAKDLVFGSKLELIQSELPNPMVIVGPSAIV